MAKHQEELYQNKMLLHNLQWISITVGSYCLKQITLNYNNPKIIIYKKFGQLNTVKYICR